MSIESPDSPDHESPRGDTVVCPSCGQRLPRGPREMTPEQLAARAVMTLLFLAGSLFFYLTDRPAGVFLWTAILFTLWLIVDVVRARGRRGLEQDGRRARTVPDCPGYCTGYPTGRDDRST